MDIDKVIRRLVKSSSDVTLYKGAKRSTIEKFEVKMGFKLPSDLKAFYQICNGFEVEEDLFRIIPLEEILSDTDHFSGRLKTNQFYLAEYLVYCDMWTIQVDKQQPDSYTIFGFGDTSAPDGIVLTHSFVDFLNHFLMGGVFEENGVYDWADKLAKKS